MKALLLLAWVRVTRWFRFKRICAWGDPPHYMGGNPLSKNETHGVCYKHRHKLWE